MPHQYKSPANIVDFPTEVLWKIFSYLKAKQLLKCREVCWRWKHTIDEWTWERSTWKRETFWRKQCQFDFKDTYDIARRKQTPGLSWRDMYRSLSLWPKLQEATVTQDEFASASSVYEEIRDFQVLRHGEIGLQTGSGIVYYDLKTLKLSTRRKISGNYFNYAENDDVIVVLGFTSDLYVLRKYIISPLQQDRTSFPSVKIFLLAEKSVYYVTFANDLYVCDFQRGQFACNFIARIDGVECIACKDGVLNVLTYERDVYTIGSTIRKLNLDHVPNLLDYMHRCNFLDRLHWDLFFRWMFILKRPMPRYMLRDIIIVKVYGDVVFVGTRYGVLRIYYAPYVNNEFDLFNSEPLKQFNFMERRDCPVLSECAIIQIDAIEGEDGHIVVVGMPKKIVLLKFSHDLKAKEPDIVFDDVQNVKIHDLV